MLPVQQAHHQSDREIRDEYRQSVLELCHEFPSTELAWDVSQHVLDRMWNSPENNTTNEFNGNIIGAKPSIVSPENNSSTTTTNYACQSCGYRLHPGWNGTTLRVKRPNPFSSPSAKRTFKRREHRKRKKAALAEEKKAKDHRHNKRELSRNDSQDASPRQKLVLLRDDPSINRLEKHLLVVTCFRCKDKTNLKGLRREQQQQQPQRNKRKYQPKPNQGTTTVPSHGVVGDLSENFERLPGLAKKPPPSSNAAKTSSRMSLLEQKMFRKKKKKGSTNNNQSGNLLNFLSSLNDN